MTDAVIVHLASAVRPGIDVLFLDTGYHFAETVGTRDAVSAVYPIRLVNVTPSRTVAEQDAELGPRLYGRNPDLCCYLRKVEPLERALTNYDAWITGVRRDETSKRRQAQVVEWDDKREMIKVNPIVSWSSEAGRRLHHRQQRAGQPAGLRRLPLHRLRDLHHQGRGGRRPAQRALGRDRQDRMRDSCLNLACPPGRRPILAGPWWPWRTGARTRARRPPSAS